MRLLDGAVLLVAGREYRHAVAAVDIPFEQVGQVVDFHSVDMRFDQALLDYLIDEVIAGHDVGPAVPDKARDEVAQRLEWLDIAQRGVLRASHGHQVAVDVVAAHDRLEAHRHDEGLAVGAHPSLCAVVDAVELSARYERRQSLGLEAPRGLEGLPLAAVLVQVVALAHVAHVERVVEVDEGVGRHLGQQCCDFLCRCVVE